jgi:hypothetical protein
MLATLYIILSLTLFALGSAVQTGWFCLRTLSFGRMTTIMGPILDMVDVSGAVIASVMGKKLGRHVNKGLLRLLLRVVRDRRFTSSVVTPQGYKRRCLPFTPTSSHTIRHSLLTSFPAPEKRERKRGKRRKKGGIIGI